MKFGSNVRRRVAVAVSGGVDSAVTALLLKTKGYDLHGVFMKNWDEADEKGTCSADADFEDAQIVCDRIGIPLTKLDFVKEYWNRVFVELVDDYQAGLTPNPDVLCNRRVKFDALFDHCMGTLGCDAVATGHYANTSFGPYLERYEADGRVRLLLPADRVKDQTLFLSQVPQEALRLTMFPLGNMLKTTVKQIARENGLHNVLNRKESYGICFIGSRNFQKFISEYVCSQTGNFIDLDTGKRLGSHGGIHHWTIGQRSKLSGSSAAYYIVKKNLENQDIYVALGNRHPSLMTDTFVTGPAHWIHREPPALRDNDVLKCYFRFQNVWPLVRCRVMKSDKGLLVKLDNKQRAIACGQYAVFYDDEECYGSARIVHLGASDYFIE